MYALYQRPNVDGSLSESVTQLATDVEQNTGSDIDIEPNIHLQIKVRFNAWKLFNVAMMIPTMPPPTGIPRYNQISGRI